ncbi:arylsulfatase [Vibrio aphrogenes]|uniref:arylsulfatase n=1 Tax=Vibrio aphrogenes TaxID=1891186 RepID=UPI0038CDA3EE
MAASKPNILVIFGDDIGQSNISAYTKGLVGYHTPNIDKIANDGVIFTDYYAEQSCTAGRSTFITGQTTLRTGLAKVGLPGADVGLQDRDVTLAQLLKPLGYATGQFGKNHLGDRDKFLPTNHGFDEFFGNLYHLNAEEEPEQRNYPQDPEFKKKYGPRGVIHSYADGKIEDTGPLTRKRMETIDEETASAAMDFMEKQVKADKPFFVWWNATRMHFRTHVKAEHRDKPGLNSRTEYADGMIEHDNQVGVILNKLDDLGVADNTIVLYTTDNGPHKNSWPDAANSPFRSEKVTNWEGAYRVPAMIRWPGHIKPGSVANDIVSGLDWFPTLAAAAGETNVKEELLKGKKVGDKTFKVHLDGYNQLPYLTGKAKESPRKEFFYFNDDGQLVALRYEDWKIVFMEQRAKGTLQVWADPFTPLRTPKLFNLRSDPYEEADITSNTYWDWVMDHVYLYVPAQAYVGQFLSTFEEYPPSQIPASFNLDTVMKKLQDSPTSK